MYNVAIYKSHKWNANVPPFLCLVVVVVCVHSVVSDTLWTHRTIARQAPLSRPLSVLTIIFQLFTHTRTHTHTHTHTPLPHSASGIAVHSFCFRDDEVRSLPPGIFFFFFFFHFILLYNTVLVLAYIDMNPPRLYVSSQTWTPLPPPTPHHPSGSSP